MVAFGAVLLVVLAYLFLTGGDGDDDRAPDRGAEGVTSTVPATSDGPGDPAPSVDPESGLPFVAERALPPEAQETLDRIDAGGPFPYPDKDGSTFGNFEGLLPAHERGYYAEYTVPTPGSRDRGARRVIAGDGGEYYWTADHYESFARILRAGS
ncbi:ribonuclease [Nocardioides anomalus]|uniref:Ribonuclease n=1 Tax=Nocardioides anomalus TaxID=2712223 RepID=A0A6G6WKN8_9ACTN|nr:ribonuclease [Nocardioides anomalus]